MNFKHFKDVDLEESVANVKVETYNKFIKHQGFVTCARVYYETEEEPKKIEHISGNTELCYRLNEIIDAVNKLVK